MISDETHPRMAKAHKALLSRLGVMLGDGTKPLTTGFLHDLFTIVKDHRSECRQKGIDFPVLVALVVPRLGIVEFKRADLDMPSIKASIVNFVRQHPDVKMIEVMGAFTGAYPDLKPGDVLEKHDTGVKAIERTSERRAQIVQEATEIIKNDDDSGGES